jgi:hypothetical protein
MSEAGSSETIASAIRDHTKALDRLLAELRHPRDGGDHHHDGDHHGRWEVPDDAKSDPSHEEVLIRYTEGKGRFDDKHHYNHLHMRMHKMDGTLDGTHDGVWWPQLTPKEMYEQPPRPDEPLNEPEGPVNTIPIRAWTKAIWTFGTKTDGEDDSVTAVGPANLHLVPLHGRKTIFLVSVAAIITNGTGKYHDARGVKTALGSTLVEGDWKSMFQLPPDKTFKAVTVETFRIIKKADIGPEP